MTGVELNLSTTIGIGGTVVRLRTSDAAFLRMVEDRYAGFPGTGESADYEFEMELVAPPAVASDEDVRVWRDAGRWMMSRGDFHAEWDPSVGRGRIRQHANPYSIDSVLRIVHSLLLARKGGLLVHAASAIRNGRAFLFMGVSGAGKTTISSLAPPDATLLTDEVSYLRPHEDGYVAFGTPFAGELAKPGANVQAPLATLYLLAQGPENKIEPVGVAEAGRALLESVLFFAHDPELVGMVFETACKLVERVPVRRLTFVPDARVWELIV